MTVEPGCPYLPPSVRGSISNPRKWWKITTNTTNQVTFSAYINTVLTDIEENPLPNGYDNKKYLMWDNLSAHLTPLVAATFELRPRGDEFEFIPIRRPPYQPKYAPIEYIFGQISCMLSQKCERDWDLDRLIQELHNCCVEVGRNGALDRTFRHCGYVF